MKLGEERSTYIFLSAYRCFTASTAIFQIFFAGYASGVEIEWVVVAIISVYSLFKIFWPIHQHKQINLTYADFGFDLLLCVSLPVYTGGLESPFLLYSLCPVLTSALFFRRRVTFFVAFLPIITVTLTQVLILRSAPYDTGLSLTLFGALTVTAFLVALLPYMMNINASQTIKGKAIIDERRRLSREMHDGVAQSLGIIRWKLELMAKKVAGGDTAQVLSEVTEINKILEETQREIRTAITELRSDKSESDFMATLARYATEFSKAYGIRCELHLTNDLVNLPLPAELQLLRITQESLSNIRRHSDATAVEIVFESKRDYVDLIIRDNGKGFDTGIPSRGYGLAVMEERAKSLGAKLTINSKPGTGTEVRVRLPVQETPRWLKVGYFKVMLPLVRGKGSHD